MLALFLNEKLRMELFLERLKITELVQSWALYRDSGDWESLRAIAHPEALMTATWYHGSFDGFIDAIQASWRKGSRSQHFQGGTTVKLQGTRALAQTRMAILVRGSIEGILVDVNCTGRFIDRVEKRMDKWKILRRSVIYEKDRIDPVIPNTTIQLDLERLQKFPNGYQHLAYLQSINGGQVASDLPTAQGPQLESLMLEANEWLYSN